jgi:hypothetical protein
VLQTRGRRVKVHLDPARVAEVLDADVTRKLVQRWAKPDDSVLTVYESFTR